MSAFELCVDRFKALGEPTRLRIALLLARQGLTVSDLVTILGQSQPRISRHLRLMVETGLLSRHQEGAWAYFHFADDPVTASLLQAVSAAAKEDDPVVVQDIEKLEGVRARRAAHAARYFAENAGRWDRIRSMHAPDTEVESALLGELGSEAFANLLDIGTGTGRMLELLAPAARRAVGVDASREMLALARAKLDGAGLPRASVRLGDVYRLPVEAGGFDLVTLHQVLHYLSDPQAAVAEAVRCLAPGGRLAVIDFAPHANEFLRDEHAHLRLGFAPAAIEGFMRSCGLAMESQRSLLPPVGDGGLTVIISIGRRAPLAAHMTKKIA